MVNSGSTTTSTAQPAITVNGSGTGINGTNAANANIGIANAPTGIGIYGAATGITGTNNAGGGAAHNNIPPFLAINFIIKYQ
jgi:microcystin-dependent protein